MCSNEISPAPSPWADLMSSVFKTKTRYLYKEDLKLIVKPRSQSFQRYHLRVVCETGALSHSTLVDFTAFDTFHLVACLLSAGFPSHEDKNSASYQKTNFLQDLLKQSTVLCQVKSIASFFYCLRGTKQVVLFLGALS